MQKNETKDHLIVALVVYGDQKKGMGHIYEGLALAEFLKDENDEIEIYFMTIGSPISQDIVKRKGFTVTHIENAYEGLNNLRETQPNILIFDMPEIPDILLRKAKETIGDKTRIIVIGDYATNLPKNARKYSDVIVNYNFGEKTLESKIIFYDGGSKVELRGPKFIILDKKLVKKGKCYKSRGLITKYLVSFGGSDPRNLTRRLLKALCKTSYIEEIEFNIVLGPAFSEKDKIKEFIEACNYKEKNLELFLFENVDSMEELMCKSDFLFTSPGRTMFEAMYLGLPLMAFTQNEIQEKTYGWLDFVFKESLIGKIPYIINSGGIQGFHKLASEIINKVQVGHGYRIVMNAIMGKSLEAKNN